MEYIAYLHKEDDSDYGVSFPDFPGCVTAGSTLEEAREMAGEALALHIQGMIEDGDPVPQPSPLDKLQNDAALRGAIAFMISAEVPGKTVRFNITARENQLEAIDRLAQAAGVSRSAFLVQAALHEHPATEPSKSPRRRKLHRSAPMAKTA